MDCMHACMNFLMPCMCLHGALPTITHKLMCSLPQVPLTLHETITLSPASGLLLKVTPR